MRQSDLIYVSNLGYLYWEHRSFGGCLCFILPYLIGAMHIASLLICWPYSITHVAILIFCLSVLSDFYTDVHHMPECKVSPLLFLIK